MKIKQTENSTTKPHVSLAGQQVCRSAKKNLENLQTCKLADSTLLLSLLVFLAPTNLFWKILPNYGYVGGLQIDYLIPKLYVSDLVCIAIVISYQLSVIRKHSKETKQQSNEATRQPYRSLLQPYGRGMPLPYLLLTTYYLLLFSRQLFTPYPISAVWFLLTTTLHSATWFIAYDWSKQIEFGSLKKVLLNVLALTILFQSVVGIFQFTYQRQFWGFYFLGEPQLTHDVGLAKADFSMLGKEFGVRILPYGTTAHPNVLAGFLVIGLFSLIRLSFQKNNDENQRSPSLATYTLGILSLGARGDFLFWITILLGCITLFLTLSISAWMSFAVGLIALYFKKYPLKLASLLTCKLANLLTPAVLLCGCVALGLCSLLVIPLTLHVYQIATSTENLSVVRRDRLNIQAIELITQHPLLGTGLNQFVAVTDNLPNQKEIVRFAQPAHCVPLLFVAENGALGIVLLILFLIVVKSKTKSYSDTFLYFLILLPILSLDHYLYTLVPGQQIALIGMLLWVD